MSAGELFDQISRQKQLPLAAARVYAAEIVLILEVLRKEQVRLLISEGLHDLVLPGCSIVNVTTAIAAHACKCACAVLWHGAMQHWQQAVCLLRAEK